MDTETIIKEAQAPGVFDVLAYVEQTAYPTREVVVFRNAAAADEYVRLVDERTKLDIAKASKDYKPSDIERDLDAEIEQLGEVISDSSMIFELRGLPPGIVNDIITPASEVAIGEEDKEEKERDHKLVAATIVRVRDSKGNIDSHQWTGEDVTKLRAFLKEGEFGKILEGVSQVNFDAAVFDKATDAGFSGRSAHVAQ